MKKILLLLLSSSSLLLLLLLLSFHNAIGIELSIALRISARIAADLTTVPDQEVSCFITEPL